MNLLTQFIVTCYIVYGLANINNLPDTYFVITIFFLFKMIVNYRKCTVSYIECKIRGVKKEEGYVQNLLDGIVDIRDDENIMYMYMFMVYMSMLFLYQQRNNISNNLKKNDYNVFKILNTVIDNS